MCFPIDFDIWETKSLIKGKNCWTTYACGLFIELMVSIEAATVFE